MRSFNTKAIFGNGLLASWLIVGLYVGVKAINWVPDLLGDDAGALLPAVVIAVVSILVAGRFAIEKIVNELWPHQESTTLRLGTKSDMATGTSFAVPLAVVGATIIVGPLNIGSDQQKQGTTEIDQQSYAERSSSGAASDDAGIVYL